MMTSPLDPVVKNATHLRSALGFGAASLGNLYRAIDDETARATVAAALDAGITHFDTAPHYGQGLSERRLADALLASGKPFTLSTKVGRRLAPIARPAPGTIRHGFVDGDPFEPVFDYSYDGVMAAFEDSQKRLKGARVSVLLAHDIGRATHGGDHERHLTDFLDGGYRAMRTLKNEGVIDTIGLGVNEWRVCEEILAHVDLDIVLLAGRYTLLEQTALDSFLPLCLHRKVAVLAAGPFNSGILSGGDAYNYSPAPEGIRTKVKALKTVCESHGVPLPAAALQFPLAHPAVTRVIAGMASPDEVAANADLLGHNIPPELWDDLKSQGLLRADAPTPEPVA